MRKSALLSSTSFITVCLLLITLLVLSYFFSYSMPLSWDVMGYHIPFVELFINDGLEIKNLDFYTNIIQEYNNSDSLYQFVSTADGRFISKYPIGWSILNLPFLAIGHFICGFTDYPTDGFSLPYQISAIVSNYFYAGVGLFYCRKVLLNFFSEKLSAFLLITLVLGTNFLATSILSIGMSHIFSATFFAILFYHLINFGKNKSNKNALFIGITIGILTLIRPTSIMALVIPFFLSLDQHTSIKAFFKYAFYNRQMQLILLSAIAVTSIQFIYWKYTTGSFFFYSYNNAGEGLDLASPYTLKFLFSFRKGWFLYTPVALLIFYGLYKLYKDHRKYFWSISIFLTLYIYVVSSWTTWWYAASFSQRPMVDVSIIIILLIGFACYKFRHNTIRNLCFGFVTICLMLNIFQTWQFYKGILPSDRITKPYYFSTFGKTTLPTKKQYDLLLTDRNHISFNTDKIEQVKNISYLKTKDSVLTKEHAFLEFQEYSYADFNNPEYLWIKTTTSALSEKDFTLHIYTCVKHKSKAYNWRNATLSSKNDSLSFTYITPNIRNTDDLICVGLWLEKGDSVLVKDLNIEIWQPKN